MVTTKPSDNGRTEPPSSRSGHGAASVIPHLYDETRRSPRESGMGSLPENPESESDFESDASPER